VRIVAFLALAAVVVLSACGGERQATSPGSTSTVAGQAPDGEPVLGIVFPPGGEGGTELVRLHPFALEAVAAPVPLGVDWLSSAISPDGALLAVGGGDSRRIDLYDTARLARTGAVELGKGLGGGAWQLAWPEPDTLFAAVGQSRVVLVDPERARVLATRRVDGVLLGGLVEVGDAVVGLVAPRGTIGPLELALITRDHTASVPLAGIVGGWDEEGKGPEEFTSREASPGLAVDPSGRRALVVPARGDVAEVDLERLRVTYHALSRPVSALGRLRNWLEPAAEAKAITGWSRSAAWTSEHLVAVTGVDHPSRPAGEEAPEERPRPAGLSFIDTREWRVRTEEENVAELGPPGENLLAFEWWCAGSEESYGVIVYDGDGNERFRRCDEEGFTATMVGDHAYLGFDDNTRYEIVDVTTGEVVASPRIERTTTLLGDG
jgi:hypothetical protein